MPSPMPGRKSAARNETQTGVKTKPPRTPRHDDEYDDSDTIDVRRLRRRSASPNRLWLLVVLVAVGLAALLMCVGLGVGGYFLFFRSTVVGTWEMTDPQILGRLTLELRRDGTGVIQGPNADVHIDYTFDRKDPMTLEWKITRIDPKQAPPFGPVGRLPFQPMIRFPMFANVNAVGLRERFRVALEGPTMRLTPENNNVVLAFRRVR
jgi:hypothetical protein